MTKQSEQKEEIDQNYNLYKRVGKNDLKSIIKTIKYAISSFLSVNASFLLRLRNEIIVYRLYNTKGLNFELIITVLLF
jgi:hypothetical protein